LDSLLPALVGFGLNTFLPGLGTAVGGIFGLGGAAGTAIAVGGATALASGDLGKGLMAGLGAYGGAGLGGNLAAAGDAAMMGPPTSAMGMPEGAAIQAASPVGTLDRLQAGAQIAGNAPGDFLKSNYMNLGYAAAPALSGAFDEEEASTAPKRNYGNIPLYKVDPVTGKSYVYKSIPGEQASTAPGIVYGNANGGLMNSYAPGGRIEDEYTNIPYELPANNPNVEGTTAATSAITDDAIKKGIVFGNVLDPDLTGHDLTDKRSDSEKAQDYLMGNGPNPFVFTSKAPVVDATKKAAEATKEIAATVEKQQQQQQRGSGGNAGVGPSGTGGFPAGLAPAANTVAQALGDMGLNALSHAVSNVAMNGAMSGTGAAPQSSAAPSTGAVNSSAGGQYGGWGSRDAGGGNTGFSGSGAATGSSTGPAAGTSNSKDNGGWGSRDAGGGDGGGHGEGGGGLGAGSGAGRYGAEGGYLTNGNFNQRLRYADGGTTDTENTVNFGGVGQLEPVNTSDSSLSDSERAQNYLMGNGPNPFLFYHSNEKKVIPAAQASADTGIAAIGGGNIGGGGGGIGSIGGGDVGGNTGSTVGTSDTGGTDFGVTNQPPGAVFNINDFDTKTTNSDFGIGNQPAGTTFDINDFDNLNNTVDNGSNSLTNNPAVGEGGETVQTGYTNSLTENPAVGEGGETGNSLIDNPAVGEGGETVSPEKFGIDYVDPSGLGAENNFVDHMDALDNYTGSDSAGDYGNDYGNDAGSDFNSGFDGGFGGIGGGGNDYDMSYRAKGGPIKSNFKKAKNINLYKSGLEHYADGGTTGSGSIDLHVPIDIGGGGFGGGGGGFGGGFGGMSQPNPDFLGQQMNSLPGYQAVQKAQQDFTNSDDYKNFQNYAREYQQQLQPQQQLSAFGGALGGSRGGSRGGFGLQGGATNQFGGSIPFNGSDSQMFEQTQMPREYNPNMPEDAFNAKNHFANGGIAALAHGGVMRPFFSGRTGKYQEHTPLMYAEGGMYNLGSYSDGGRLLRGPGDGVSDDIPATIGEKQPARLADGEFVVPARIVSELGNGSTEAGARKLYAMMDRVQKARNNTVGKDKIAANTRAEKYLPA
jgi:hypothetical protein